MGEKKLQQTSNKNAESILILLFFIFVSVFTTAKISGDDDIFWHMEIGRYITENKVIPSSDVFGFVTSGREWIPFEWGWDVLSYSVYSFAGYSGVGIFRTIIILFSFFIFILIVKRAKVNLNLFFLIALLFLFGAQDRLISKPQIISYLFYALLIYIIIDYKYFNRFSFKKIYFLPMIFLIWTNMHMGVLVGVIILVMLLVTEGIDLIKSKQLKLDSVLTSSNKDFLKLTLICVVSILCLMLNPHSIKTFQYVGSHLNMKMMADVFEWRSPFDKIFTSTVYFYVYLIFLGLGVVALYLAYKMKDNLFQFIIVILMLNSFRASRFSVDYMILCLPIVIILLNILISKSKYKYFLSSKYFSYSLIAVFSVLTILSATNKLYDLMNYPKLSGFGVDERDYPKKMFDFIKENKIDESISRPFNTYGCGGYYIWEFKGKKNFIDSRGLNDEIYYDFKTINNKQPGFENKIEQFGFDSFIWFFPGLTSNSVELQSSVISYLIYNSDRWKLVYWDDTGLLFLKNEEKFKDIISRHEYKFVNPFYYIYQNEPLKKALSTNQQDVIREIQRNYKLNPDGMFINSIAKTFKVPVNK